MKKNFLPLSNTRGVSLMVAIMFVSAFLLIMGGLFDARLRALLAVAERGSNDVATYLAQSAAEIGSLYASVSGVGADSAQLPQETRTHLTQVLAAAASAAGIETCADGSCVSFQVRGRTVATLRFNNQNLYSVPEKGTGTAAATCANADDADDGCNWNKLFVGDSIEIPLYYTDSNGREVRLDLTQPNSYFSLRVRAPCEGYVENCPADDRIVLYPPTDNADAYRDVKKDQVLMQWSINSTDGEITLLARDQVDRQDSKKRSLDLITNNEISSGRINDVSESAFGVLSHDLSIQRIPTAVNILSALLPNNQSMVMRLNAIGQPRRNPEDREQFDINNKTFFVPFLEYQLLVSQPLSDQKIAIDGQARIGSITRDFHIDKKRKPTLGGFVLENF
ncbi:hypothetical protein KBD59_03305 [Candidatus Gracilibacteria bacterium]|nr:hypothetical protein [Candidatus Gracilibacteria bacterium]